MTSTSYTPKSIPGRTLVCVGTSKGLWLFSSDDRIDWTRHGPFLAGVSVPAVLLQRSEHGYRLYSPALDAFWGAAIRYSDDFGATWTEAEVNPRFPAEFDVSLKAIWALEARADGTLFAGVEPAALFVSEDHGRTWQLSPGLWNHPHRPQWEPGGGGLCLHTIVFDPRDPRRMYVAISTGGVYRSEDGGATWRPRNVGLCADFLPDKQPEFGQCVHKIALSPVNPDRLYLQNHGGVYRSDDGGDSWTAREDGLTRNFGFPIVVDPRDPETAYIFPLDDQEAMPRWSQDGRVAVYRTRNGGDHWEALTNGLPQENAYFTVLRDAMCVDGGDPLGVYFGTRSGHVYYSADGGDHWSCLAEMLPPVLSVKAYQL